MTTAAPLADDAQLPGSGRRMVYIPLQSQPDGLPVPATWNRAAAPSRDGSGDGAAARASTPRFADRESAIFQETKP